MILSLALIALMKKVKLRSTQYLFSLELFPPLRFEKCSVYQSLEQIIKIYSAQLDSGDALDKEMREAAIICPRNRSAYPELCQ